MRLRNVLPFSVVTLMSTAALAQQAAPAASADKPATPRTGVQFRIESVGTHKKVGDAPAVDTQTMQLTTARLLASGELSDVFSYQLRLSLRSAANFSADRNSPDGVLAALDRAWVEHRPLPGLALRFGRLPIAFGAIENDYSSIDVYYYSYQNELINRYTPVTTGADVSYTIGKHTVSLQGFNGFYDGTVDTKGTQKGGDISTALAYRGNIADGLLRPIVTYDRLTRIRNGAGASRDDKVTFTQFGVGTVVSAYNTDLEIEYDTFNKPSFTSYNTDASTKAAVQVDNKEVKVNSVVGQLAYNLTDLGLRPFLKASSDVEKTDDKDSFKAKRGALGVEWKPSSTKGLRYHAVVIDQKDDAYKADATGTTTKTRTDTRQYLIGLVAKM